MMKKMSAVLLSGLLASQMVWAETGEKSDSNANDPKSENKSLSKEQKWGAPFGHRLTNSVKALISDSSNGAVEGLKVELKKLQADGSWQLLSTEYTDSRGGAFGIDSILGREGGTYKLVYHTRDYLNNARLTIYPHVEVPFEAEKDEFYIIHLILLPNDSYMISR